ncbi:MAG: PKD domain-containing protein [bacterium]|nr:PKD domain-containing protein [bacterium]
MPSGLAPEVAFSWEPVQIEIDDSVSFVDRSIGNPTTWSWNFGDGSTSAEQHPSHSYPSAGTYIVKLEAANEWGSHSDSQRLSVAPKQECTIACSVEAPSSGSIDVEIAMSASITTANCQDETLYSWDFGDGEDDSGVTTFHRYLLSGSYQWTMNASTSGASCSAGGVIEIEAEGPETCDFTYWVPVAVHASGAYSSSWRSDLGLLGFGTTDAAVRLQLHGNGGPFTANGAVKAGAMVRIPDVVARIIPGADHSGALEVCSDQSLVVTSRTYNLLATDDPCMALGTMGQVLDGVESSTGMAAGEVALLSHLAENGAFRTNIGVVNTGSSPATVEIRLHDESGNAVSSFRKDLAPGEWWQDIRPFSHRAGIDDIAAGWARVEVVSGSGIFTVGFVIDNLTNDASAIRMRCESCW